MEAGDWKIYAARMGGMGPWLRMWAFSMNGDECYGLNCDGLHLKASPLKLSPREIERVQNGGANKLVGQFPGVLIECLNGETRCAESLLWRLAHRLEEAGVMRSQPDQETLVSILKQKGRTDPALETPLPSPPASGSNAGPFWAW